MAIADALRARRWRLAGHHRPLPDAFAAPLQGARVLEIGGPSAVFGAAGLVPVYPRAAAVDNVQWAADTAWHGHQDAGAYAPDGTPTGVVHVLDDVALATIGDGAYDAVMSSHVIEHLANPLRALEAWRRVTGGGRLLLVAPHMEGTFDHRRPVTTLDHLIDDHRNGTTEDDVTHVAETLELHDRSRDGDPDDDATWRAKRQDNPRHRLVHHHTFTTPSLLALLDHAGVQVEQVAARWPHDIYVAGRFVAEGARPDNAAVLAPGAPWRHASPFRRDRAGA